MTKKKYILKSVVALFMLVLIALSTVTFDTVPTTYAATGDDDVVTSDTVVVKPNYSLDDSDDPQEDGTANMAFAFESGASLLLEGDVDEDGNSVGGLMNGQYLMRFTLKQTNPEHENLLEWSNKKVVRVGFDEERLSSEYYEYRFTVYRSKDENYAVPMTEFYIGLAYGGNVNDPYLYRIVARRDFSYYDEVITPQGFITEATDNGAEDFVYGNTDMHYLSATPTNSEIATACDRVDAIRNKNYTVLSYREMTGGGLLLDHVVNNDIFNTNRPTDAPSGDILIETKNPNTGYFVTFDYNYTVCTSNENVFFGWYEVKYGTRDKDFGHCQTLTRSFYDIVYNMNSIAFELETQANRTSNPEATIAQAEKVLYDGIKQVVAIEYLEQIPGTPFGTKKKASVEVPVYNGAIFRTDVYNALGVSDLDCAGSNCNTFVYNETTKTYTAVYLEHVYLRMETADGQQRDYFLDINKSFDDFYGPLVEKEIISEEVYGYLLDGYYTAYPQLDAYASGDFYGLFGFTALPDTMTLDKVFSEIFGLSEDVKDCKDVFNFQENLSKDAYDTLLEDYDYGWLDKIWQEIWANVGNGGKHMSTYYAFYCTGESRLAKIDEVQGEGGAITATIPQFPNYLNNFFASIWQPTGNKIMIVATAAVIVATSTAVIVVKKKNT